MFDVQPEIPTTVTWTPYVTKPGDSARSIAKQFNVDWRETWSASENDSFRRAMSKHLGGAPGMMAVIQNIDFAYIPPGLSLSLPTKHVKMVNLPAASRPYSRTVAFHKETLGSTILTPAETKTGNFELRITLPIFLRQMNPSGGVAQIAGRNVHVTPWMDVEFERFKFDVKAKAEAFWRNRFRLWAPSNYPYFRWPDLNGKEAGVDCTIEVSWVQTQGPDSLTAEAYKRDLVSAHVGVQEFERMDSFHWTDDLLKDQTNIQTPDDEGNNITSNSNTAAHEFGHLLMLEHSGGLGDQQQDYGAGQEKWKILNIMGFGDQVNRTNSVPWLRHIYWHTGVVPNAWTVHTLDSNGNPMYL